MVIRSSSSESDVLALINRHELRVLRLNESDIGVPVRIYYPHTRVPPPVLPIIVCQPPPWTTERCLGSI